jgi:hypothetical protein
MPDRSRSIAPARPRRVRTTIALVALALITAAGHRFAGAGLPALGGTAERAAPTAPQALDRDALHVVDVDLHGSRIHARRVHLPEGRIHPGGWAAGGSLIFAADHHGRRAIFSLPAGAGAPHLLADGAADDERGPRVTPDGAAVLFLAPPALLSRQPRIMRVSATGGEVAEVAAGSFIDGGARCTVAPAMLCAVAERHDDGRHVIFTALNPQSGRGREIFADLRWELSPDGTRIALADARASHVRVLLIGGPAAEQIAVSRQYGIDAVSFTADSRGVIVPSVDDGGASLWSIGLQGAAQLLWEEPGAVHISGLPSPDGRQVLVRVRTRIEAAVTRASEE